MNRAQRRKQAKIARHRELVAKRAGEPFLAGDALMRSTGIAQEVPDGLNRDLPPKQPGQHRWIATAMFRMSDDSIANARNVDEPKFLDTENLVGVYFGCWDCEQALGQIEAGSPCPAEACQ